MIGGRSDESRPALVASPSKIEEYYSYDQSYILDYESGDCSIYGGSQLEKPIYPCLGSFDWEFVLARSIHQPETHHHQRTIVRYDVFSMKISFLFRESTIVTLLPRRNATPLVDEDVP